MKVKQKWNNLAMRYKMIIMLYAIILPVLLILGGLFYFIMLNNFKNEVIKAYDGVVNQIDSSISFIQKDTQDFSTYLCINDTILNILNEDEPSEDAYAEGLTHQSLRFILDIIATKSHINSLAIYSHKGQPTYHITTDTSVFIQDIEKVLDTPLYEKAFKAKGAPIWSNMKESDTSLLEINKSDKIILTRTIFNYTEVEPIGYLVVGIEKDYFSSMCRQALRSEQDGIVVVFENKPLITAGNVPDEFVELVSNNSNAIDFDFDVDDATIIKDGNDDSLHVYYLLSNSILEVRRRTLLIITVSIAIGLLILILPIEFAVANRLTSRLKKLLSSMKKLEKGDFSQRVEFDANDEIGEVGHHYNRMVQSLKELIDKNYRSQLHERESQLLALQAQINPHFLYNTLDSIYWRSMEEGSSSAAKMTYSLSQLFRLSLNKGQSITRLKNETELLKYYLEIQKERFGHKLRVEFDITQEANDAKIPMLILQPFVENSIIHGIERSEDGGYLKISGWCKGDVLHVEILDTGKGMSKKKIQGILEKPKSTAPGSLNGYAIYNINERLNLTYENKYSLNIESNKGKGTVVKITLPYETR